MRAIALAAFAQMMAGCSDGTPPTAYKHVTDQLRAATGLDVPCFRTIDGEPGRLPDRDCYRLEHPQRMQGVAITGPESGSFYPRRTARPKQGEQSGMWLRLEPGLLSGQVQRSCEEGCAIWLDFVGRQTSVEGSYGHMGSATHLIVADRIVHVKVLE